MDQQAVSRAERAPVRRDAGPGYQPASAPAVVDNQPRAVALRKLSDAMHDSPRMATQRALAETMHNSPRAIAQRKLGDGMSVVAPPRSTGRMPVAQMSVAPAPIIQRLSILQVFGKPVDELNRQQLNAVIDRQIIDEKERIEAEGVLKDLNERSIARIKALVESNNLAGALAAAARLVGVTDIPVRPTTDFASVIPEGEEIPRGTPHGVTVPEGGNPVVYIHEDWIKKWAKENAVGNLLSTIVHETKHAKQDRANSPTAERGDAKEFEAYAEEISTAYTTARQFETNLLPDADHIRTAFDKAREHYRDLNLDEQQRYAAKLHQIETVMPRLGPLLERTDVETGRTPRRVKRIETIVRQALEADTSGEVGRLQTEANKIFQTLPPGEQRKLEVPLDKVDEHYKQLWRSFK